MAKENALLNYLDRLFIKEDEDTATEEKPVEEKETTTEDKPAESEESEKAEEKPAESEEPEKAEEKSEEVKESSESESKAELKEEEDKDSDDDDDKKEDEDKDDEDKDKEESKKKTYSVVEMNKLKDDIAGCLEKCCGEELDKIYSICKKYAKSEEGCNESVKEEVTKEQTPHEYLIERMQELSGVEPLLEKKKEEKWMQKASDKMEKKGTKGALSKQLGYDEEEDIPVGILKKIVKAEIGSKVKCKKKEIKITALIKKRATFALNAKTKTKKGK